MKINWFTGLMAVMILFIIFIFTCIFLATREKIQLVREDYYEQELKYQEVIDRKKNLKALGTTIEIVQKSDSAFLTFPTTITKGNIHFYKLNSASQDVNISLNNTSSKTVGISTKNMHRGLYTLKILWDNSTEKYYFEKTLRL